jgi:chemotaxis protein CheD
MRVEPGAIKHVSIQMGEFFASREPAVVETLLGSCVAACLFDPVQKVGGMNHFLLPRPCQADPVLARYGVHAMELLIESILEAGGKRSQLQAKVFGAAAVLTLDLARINVPEANERFIREFLAAQGIPLSGERLGGVRPLKVRMFTDTGKVLVRALPETQLDRVAGVETECISAAFERRWSWFEGNVGSPAKAPAK